MTDPLGDRAGDTRSLEQLGDPADVLVALRVADDQVAAASMVNRARPLDRGGYDDHGGNRAHSRRPHPLDIVDSVLEADDQRVVAQVRFDAPGSGLGVDGLDTEEHQLGLR